MDISLLEKANAIQREIDGIYLFRQRLVHMMNRKPFSFSVQTSVMENARTYSEEWQVQPYETELPKPLQDSMLASIDNMISELEKQIMEL